MTDSASREPGRELVQLGYNGLFLSMDDPLERLGTDRADLRRLVEDADAPLEQRFLAAEVLFRVDKRFPPKSLEPELARLYVGALRDGVVTAANAWSMPGELDGPAGQHLVKLGSAAESELESALGDATSVTYAGSREASIGNAYKYRVKDIAAQLLRAIRGESLEVDTSPSRRDRAIRELRNNSG
jgi:hypothetical protein